MQRYQRRKLQYALRDVENLSVDCLQTTGRLVSPDSVHDLRRSRHAVEKGLPPLPYPVNPSRASYGSVIARPFHFHIGTSRWMFKPVVVQILPSVIRKPQLHARLLAITHRGLSTLHRQTPANAFLYLYTTFPGICFPCLSCTNAS